MTALEFQRLSAVEGLPVNGAVYWVYSSSMQRCECCRYDAITETWRVFGAEKLAQVPNVTHYVRLPERI